MPTTNDCLTKALSVLFAALAVTAAAPAFPDMILQKEGTSADQSFSPDAEKSDILALEKKRDATPAPPELSHAIKHGIWTRACGLATGVLAEHEANLDALGVFAICQALLARKEETAYALSRLHDVEPSPGYYATLTQGVANLRNGSIKEAEADLNRVLKIRHEDPLATYFRGELLHAQHKEADAIVAFKAVLRTWPKFAPALSATARLMAVKNAPKQTLDTAISMSERAALIEPMNLAYWKQTADLYDQAGQHDRAQAIRLQWLNRPRPPDGKK